MKYGKKQRQSRSYVPERGDIVWLNFSPQSGHEQVGKRPALVISPQSYNSRAGLALFCLITSRVKGYPFEVNLPPGKKISGVILSDQIKSLDWQSRHASFIIKVPNEVIQEVMAKLHTLVN